MERRPTTRPGSEPLLILVPPCFALSLFPLWNSSYPGGSIPPSPMKTLTDNFSSRHTRLSDQDIRPERPSVVEGRHMKERLQGEENTKGEEKANRYTWKLENP
jgi:hypothetical protein